MDNPVYNINVYSLSLVLVMISILRNFLGLEILRRILDIKHPEVAIFIYISKMIRSNLIFMYGRCMYVDAMS